MLDPEDAERLRGHYASPGSAGRGLPLFAVLGVALIGLGVILLLAHNWEDLSRAQRAALSFALLLGAQGAAAFGLLRRRTSVAWSESASLFLMLASAATIALIGQTYHVPGDLRGFLLSWLLPCLPLVYLFDSRASAALYLVGISGWLAASRLAEDPLLPYWGYLALGLPYLVWLDRRGDHSVRSAFLAAIAVPAIACGAVFGVRLETMLPLVLLGVTVAGGTHALGAMAPERGAGAPYYAAPARWLAALAIACTVFVLGYEGGWRFAFGKLQLFGNDQGIVDPLGALAVGLLFGVLALRGALVTLRAGDWPAALLCGFPLVVAIGVVAVRALDSGIPGMLLANAFGLAVGTGIALAGVRENRIALANAGLLLLAALIFARFSDWQLSFTTRGLAFIALGVAFLMLNLRLRRLRAEATA